MSFVVHFLDGPEAGVVRRLSNDPGREFRIALSPANINISPARYEDRGPVWVRTITYALLKLPEGWPSNYWKDTEYVAKLMP